jgi:UDP-N-acetylglucosamine--N-acetylmuramyl-(pentapeptide) pyrophosphoryl-undecaprenol N-acetylglucosamine transferase
MNDAYSACDLVLARAGATTIAEILFLGLPSILVPSPNVAENHQYYNAESLSKIGAAILLEDKMLSEKFLEKIKSLLQDRSNLKEIANLAKQASKPNATAEIAERAIAYAKKEAI